MKTKQLKIFIVLLLLFPLIVALLESGCKKEKDEYSIACGIEYPLRNIEWLRNSKEAIQSNDEITSASIVLYRLNDKDYISVSIKLRAVYDNPGTIIHDCEGNVVYTCGGNQPPGLDSCSTFFSNAQRIQNLWEK